MAGPSLDKKITQLPIVLTKPAEGWLVIVVQKNGIDVTSRIKLSVLLP